MPGSLEERLATAGLRLPALSPPKGAYVPAKIHGDMLWVAGHTDRTRERPPTRGVVGGDLDIETARAAARGAALNLLAAAVAAVPAEQLAAVTFLRGYVVAAPGFGEHPAVIDGASEILAAAFDDAAHARAAIGVATLPGGACVELEAVFRVDR